MPTTLLSIGYAQVMTQNQVFALPSGRCLLFSDTAGTYEQANVVTGPFIALVLTNGEAEVAGGFIRCTTASPTVILKPE
jgi:hypothetical protein